MSACASCRADVPAGASFCPSCGAQHGQGASTTDLKALLDRVPIANRVVGVVTLLVFISMFLPWYSATVYGISVSIDGYHRWGWVTFVGMLIAATAAAVTLGVNAPSRAMRGRLPLQLAMVGGLVEVLGAVAFLIDISSSANDIGSPSVGLFLALIAGLGTAGVAYRASALRK